MSERAVCASARSLGRPVYTIVLMNEVPAERVAVSQSRARVADAAQRAHLL